MRLEITNLYKDNKKLSKESISKLYSIFIEKLNKRNIRFSSSTTETSIVFHEVEPGRVFSSARVNKIILSETDKRRTPDKTFLRTHALTKAQDEAVFDCILGGLKRLNIKASVVLTKKDKTELWHEDLVDMAIDKPTKYPVEL